MCSLGRINIFNLVFTIQRQLTKMDLHSRTLGGSQTTTLFVGVTFVYIPCLYCLIHNTICTFREYVSTFDDHKSWFFVQKKPCKARIYLILNSIYRNLIQV